MKNKISNEKPKELSFCHTGNCRLEEVAREVVRHFFNQAVIIGDPVTLPGQDAEKLKAEGVVGLYHIMENLGRRNERAIMRPEDWDSWEDTPRRNDAAAPAERRGRQPAGSSRRAASSPSPD